MRQFDVRFLEAFKNELKRLKTSVSII